MSMTTTADGFIAAIAENMRALYADEISDADFAERHRTIWDEVRRSGGEHEVMAALEKPPSSR